VAKHTSRCAFARSYWAALRGSNTFPTPLVHRGLSTRTARRRQPIVRLFLSPKSKLTGTPVTVRQSVLGSARRASASHMSEQGAANTNGPNAADRDKGLDRAEDRMSQEGIEHSKATTQQSKKQSGKSTETTGKAGGASASHMSPQRAASTNGPNAADRDKGLDRAEDRANQRATANPKATTPLERQKDSTNQGTTTQ